MQFSSDSKLLATSSADSTVSVWSANNWEPVRTFQGQAPFTRALAFSPSAPLLAAGDMTGVATYDFGEGKTVARWQIAPADRDDGVGFLSFNDVGRQIVGVISGENVDRSRTLVWSIGATSAVGEYEFAELATGLWSDGSNQLCIETYNPSVDSRSYRLRRQDGSVLFDIDLRSRSAGGIPVSSADRSVIALGNRCFASAVQLLRTPTGDLLLSREAVAASTPIIAVSPDGGRIAISTSKRGASNSELTVTLVSDAAEGWRAAAIGVVETLKFSPDGRLVAAFSSSGRAAYFFDAFNGRLKGVVPQSARACVFSPDGRWFVSGGASISITDVTAMWS
jgi:WD40 repeat protein